MNERSARDLFEILAREHADLLTGLLRALVRDDALVDDLFQETMLTAWRRLDSYDRRRPFGPWLSGIAVRLVRRSRERRARELFRADADLVDRLEEEAAALSSTPAAHEGLLERLRECLGRLPERLREALQLAYEDGLGAREVAERAGGSVEAVKKRLQRGRSKLAECLRAAGGLA